MAWHLDYHGYNIIMPNKRNNNRTRLSVHLSETRRKDINEYLAKQKNLENTIEIALLIVQKLYGNEDLPSAFVNSTLKNSIDLNIENIKVDRHDKEKDNNILKDKVPALNEDINKEISSNKTNVNKSQFKKAENKKAEKPANSKKNITKSVPEMQQSSVKEKNNAKKEDKVEKKSKPQVSLEESNREVQEKKRLQADDMRSMFWSGDNSKL